MPRTIDQRLIKAQAIKRQRIQNKWYQYYEVQGLRYERAMERIIMEEALSESTISQIVRGYGNYSPAKIEKSLSKQFA